MTSAETIFLTGFPGFIAGRLLKRLANNDRRFLLLVQPALVALAQSQIRKITEETGRAPKSFQILEGDITQTDFGLSPLYLEKARAETNTIFHLAALYDLSVSRETAMRVNVAGTRNVNVFARSLKDLRRYHYVSTCYVAGKRSGRILESELEHEAGFRNYYEETKYLAEIEVAALKNELPVTIHRPAVVCGDSLTGETAKYDGIYYLINYLLKWAGVLTLFNIGNREVSLNLVPIDFVVEAMAALAEDERAVGKTVQLADPDPLSTYELFNTIARSIKQRGSLITIPARLVEFSLMLPPAPRITDLPHHGVPYFFLRQTYDTSLAQDLLEPHGIRCPPFASYADTIVGYAARHPVPG
ncbi:MAG TPA: SDR family oxidoreductase [Pyrinomonadaceae bacterium]|nr:SDR family oxidoreductase [Pyrinomonadaceae bacterium]